MLFCMVAQSDLEQDVWIWFHVLIVICGIVTVFLYINVSTYISMHIFVHPHMHMQSTHSHKPFKGTVNSSSLMP